MPDADRSLKNSTLRVATAVVGIPVVVAALYAGGWAFAVLAVAVSLAAQLELYGLARRRSIEPFQIIGLMLGLLVLLRTLVGWVVPAAAALLVISVVALPFLSRRDRPLEELAVTILGVVYPTVLFSFLIELRSGTGLGISDAKAFQLTLLVLIIVWTADTVAYFFGKRFGRRPMAPKISPGKTWEGFAAGAVGAVLVAVGIRMGWPDSVTLQDSLVLGLIGGLIGPLGDLAESSLKRSVEAKDAGSLLPGHGGVLDRIDALIVVLPLSYLYLFATSA